MNHWLEFAKYALGYAGSATALIAYGIYISDIAKGHTKPHVFSWFLWGLLAGIIFGAQILKGGGAGSWVTGISAFAGFAIAILGCFKGEKSVAALDWIFLGGTVAALLCWFFVKSVAISTEIATLIAVLAYGPTLRKGWEKPHEDMAASFGLNALKYLLAVLALQSYSLETTLFPAALIVMNCAVAVVLLTRRNPQLHA